MGVEWQRESDFDIHGERDRGAKIVSYSQQSEQQPG